MTGKNEQSNLLVYSEASIAKVCAHPSSKERTMLVPFIAQPSTSNTRLLQAHLGRCFPSDWVRRDF